MSKGLRLMVSIFVVLGLVGMSNVSWAKGEFKKACKGDYKKFCKGVKPGAGRILECLSAKEAELSEGCKTAVTERKAAIEKFKTACGNDVETLCKDVKIGKGRKIACLKGAIDKLSPECKALFEGEAPPVEEDTEAE